VRLAPRAALGLLFLGLCAVTVIWVTIDRTPPAWDHANHLGHALSCHRDLAERGLGGLHAILEETAFYPPLAPCAAGLLYFVFPVTPLVAQSVMLLSLGLGLLAVFGLASWLWDEWTGLLAAFLYGTAPFVVFSLTNFQLDLPLAAAVAGAIYALARTEQFSRRGWTLGLGLLCAAGLLTKPTFPVYVLPAVLAEAWRAVGAPDRRRRLGSIGLALLIAAAVSLPWYGPRLIGMPGQFLNRSFKQAAEQGSAPALSSGGLLFYPSVFPTEIGYLAVLVFALGLWTVRRDLRARRLLWAAALVPFVMILFAQNKNLRYALPLVPAAVVVAAGALRALAPRPRRILTAACVALGLLQVSMTAFALPDPPNIRPLPLPPAIPARWSAADWQHERILDDLARLSAGRASVTVSVVPNHSSFSVSNFRYESARRRLPIEMVRPWPVAPFGIDFAILKTGDQGPEFSVAKPRRIMQAFESDPYLGAIYPVVGEYPLPDGSRAQLRMRRVAPAAGVTAEELARRLTTDPARLLPELVREATGMTATLQYRPEAIVRGEVDALVLRADTAVIGELNRKDRAPLRVRDIDLRVEGLLFNPARLARTGQLEILGARALRIERLRITDADLRELLRGQPAGSGMTVELGEGMARVRSTKLGPALEATVRLGPGREGAPFALDVTDVRVARVPIPGAMVSWVVRQFDPTLRLRDLPVAVSLAPTTLRSGRVEVGAPER
jgi:4-amino-4-deoxy-L-arabinose transferase-like glycosyltransferase